MDRLPVRPRPARNLRTRNAAAGDLGAARAEILEPRRLLAGASPAPAMADEHMAIMGLVADAAVTVAAVHSGNWSDPATWRSLAGVETVNLKTGQLVP